MRSPELYAEGIVALLMDAEPLIPHQTQKLLRAQIVAVMRMYSEDCLNHGHQAPIGPHTEPTD